MSPVDSLAAWPSWTLGFWILNTADGPGFLLQDGSLISEVDVGISLSLIAPFRFLRHHDFLFQWNFVCGVGEVVAGVMVRRPSLSKQRR